MSTRTIKGIDFKPLYRNANKDLARAWVKELRNPKRKQVRGALRTDEGMCCLGVLCDIVDPYLWDHYTDDGDNFWAYANKQSLPPQFVSIKLFGEYGTLVLAYGDGKSVTAAELNDVHKFTFAEIAEAVEVAFDLI